MKKLWGSRFKKSSDKLAEAFTESISFDYRLYRQDIAGSAAHVEMLAKQKIIPRKDASKILAALKTVEKELSGKISRAQARFDPSLEDIHTYIEKRVVSIAGEKAGLKMHTARSRNDQVALDLRLYVRMEAKEIVSLLQEVNRALSSLSKKYRALKFPGFTHLQVAAPVKFGDYADAYSGMFGRDIVRLKECLQRLNYSPLGAGAVAGTTLPVDRKFTAKKLGFRGVIENTVDAVSDRDFAIEYLFDLAMIMMHVSRLSEDLIIWLSPGFKLVEIGEQFMTGSSLLPQKKNPDVCELARGKTGRTYGNLVRLLTLMKGIPLSYNRDMQEDKEALFDSTDTVKTCLKIFSRMLPTLRPLAERAKDLIESNFGGAQILVEALVKKGVEFRRAHELVGKLIRYYENRTNPEKIENL